ncbi:MAG: hypothetical protein AAFY16_14495 [Cyanobacteria bacterium J06642_3]
MRDKKSQNPLTRRGVVLGGAAAMAGVAAAIPKQEPVVAQEASDSRQQISARRLEGKVAVVPGAARAIGRACAVSLAREGADVTIMDIAQPNAFPDLNYPMASMDDLGDIIWKLLELANADLFHLFY